MLEYPGSAPHCPTSEMPFPIKKISMLRWMPPVLPVLILAVVYGAWGVAFLQLGRRPIPSMDDPKYIGGLSTQFTDATSILILVLLVAWGFSLLASAIIGVLPRTTERGRRGMQFVLGVVSMALLLALIRFSPGGALAWFMD